MLSQEPTLKTFEPATVVRLRQDIAPLMQWRTVRGMSDAYTLDLLIARMQIALLRKSAQVADLKIQLMDRLAALQMHLNPVREKAEVVKRVKSDELWNGLTVQALEEVRVSLRGIMHHRDRGGSQALPPKIVDITETESGILYSRRPTTLKSVEMRAYKQLIEAELKKHFDTDPTLKKIRAGEPVTAADLRALESLVLTQSASASREVLEEFFKSTAAPLQLAIREIIGMDPKAVEQKFSEFARKHPQLTAKQTRFLALLQNHIAKFGSITLDRLYETPFTVVDADGLDGVFEDETEINDLIQVIGAFSPPDGDRPSTNANERSE